MSSPRYLVGIDLGTTHTVVAYTPITDELESSPINIFEIDQLIAPGEVARKPLLPSFRYHPADDEISRQNWYYLGISSQLKVISAMPLLVSLPVSLVQKLRAARL